MLRAFIRNSRLTMCGAAITVLSAAVSLAQDQTNAANPQISSNNTGSAPQNFNPPTRLPPFSGVNAAAQATADQTLGMAFANTQGLTISGFSDSSPLANLGLQVGDQIFAFNGQALGGNPNTLMNRLITASRSGQPASMTIYRNGEQVAVNIPTTALQSVAQARAQLGNTRVTAANQAGQNTSAQAVQSARASVSAGGTGAASTGSAIGSGAGTLNLGTSGTGTSGTTAGTDANAAVNAVAGFQNSGGVAVTNQTQGNQGQGALNSVAQSLGLTFANTSGNSLTITSIAPNSPFAGLLQVGDQLTSLDGRPLNNPMNLFNQLSLAARGDQSATLSIMRNGSPQTVSLSNSLLDRIAQTQPLLTPDGDRLASRPDATQKNTQTSVQNSATGTEKSAVQRSIEQRNAETGLLTPGAVTGSVTSGENSNLPTTTITPSGPRITVPGQNQGRGRSGAVAPGGGTGVRPMPHTGPGAKAPSGGARPAGGGAAASGGGAAAGGS